MPAIRLHRVGEEVVFADDGMVKHGVCNGDPVSLDPQHPWVLTHLPVYLHMGDKCLMVAMENITEWHEVGDDGDA